MSYQPFFNETWNLKDSDEYRESVVIPDAVVESLHLMIVVVPGKVLATARNEGFSATTKCRVLPLSISDIDAVDMSPNGRRRAPKLVDAAVVMKAMGYRSRDELAELLPLSVADPAVLWDLDVFIGSTVHMPLSRTSFRIVSSSK